MLAGGSAHAGCGASPSDARMMIDPLPGRRLLVGGRPDPIDAPIGQALDDPADHRAIVAERLLARGAPGRGATGQQRRAVGVPNPVDGSDDHEVVGAELAARGLNMGLVLAATPALAFRCPHEMARVDKALRPTPNSPRPT